MGCTYSEFNLDIIKRSPNKKNSNKTVNPLVWISIDFTALAMGEEKSPKKLKAQTFRISFFLVIIKLKGLRFISCGDVLLKLIFLCEVIVIISHELIDLFFLFIISI